VVNEIVRYWIERGQADAFLEACRDASDRLGQSPHCRSVDLSRSQDVPEEFLLIVGWDGLSRDRNAVRESHALRPFGRAERPFSSEILERLRYGPVPLRPGPAS
jgi:hypothetical protein